MQVFGRTKKGAIEIAPSLDFMIVRACVHSKKVV